MEFTSDTIPKSPRRGDGDRGQTKGQTRAVGQRGEAQAEVGNEEEFKGRKRLQGRRGPMVMFFAMAD